MYRVHSLRSNVIISIIGDVYFSITCDWISKVCVESVSDQIRLFNRKVYICKEGRTRLIFHI